MGFWPCLPLLLVFLLLPINHTCASIVEGSQLELLKRELVNANPLESWIPGTNPCDSNWYGVACIGDKVSTLNLSNLFLQGSLPSQSFTGLPGLTKLLLANNSFTGSLPDTLFLLSNLTHLDVSYNSFSGTISTGLGSLTKLQVLSLTGNPFGTSIGVDFSELTQLRYVLLSYCGFTGSVPQSLFTLPSVYALDLENNSFSGELPRSVWRKSGLSILGLSNTLLSIDIEAGDYASLVNFIYLSLPSSVEKSLPKSIRNALPGLRGVLCVYVEWISCKASQASPSPPLPPPSPQRDRSITPEVIPPPGPPKKKQTAAIVGGVVGGLTFIITGSCLAVYFLHKRRSTYPVTAFPDFNVKAGLELEIVTNSQSFVVAHAFTYGELEKATNNFDLSNLVGSGSFGQVFRGTLTNGKAVAIKRMDASPHQNPEAEKEFRMEVDLLSRFNHPNLVRLFGYCADGRHRLLVYEFLSNGSLECFFKGRGQMKTRFTLDFRRRLLIALGSAKGLAFLHAGGEDGDPIVHRDFKSSNILLDEFFLPKVSDFGFAKLLDRASSHASTRVIGTFGYFDPIYTATGRLTVKADVYSFGVVLLQLLTGKPAVVPLDGDEAPQHIVAWSQDSLNDKKKLKRILDKDLGSAFPGKCVQRLANLASCCLRESADRRPTMIQCVQVLEELLVECATHLESL